VWNSSIQREASVYKNIPIEYLDAFRQAFPGMYRIRYRGSRTNPLDKRCRQSRRADCLKQFANRFSAYYKGPGLRA
jgi:hypothetical protein